MILQNSKGFLAADFLFSLVIATGLCIILFSLSYTLFVAEISQYIAFSTARAHSAAHVDVYKQQEMAKNKFNELINKPSIVSIYKNGWFKLSQPDIRSGESNSSNPIFTDYPETEADGAKRVPQVGVRLSLSIKLLELKIPLLGNTYEEEDQFKANVTGLLFREPSMKECQEQLKYNVRYKAILDLDQRFRKLGQATAAEKDFSGSELGVYIPMEDNGC